MDAEQAVVERKPSLAELQLKMLCHFFVLGAEARLGVISEANEDRLFLDLTCDSLEEIVRRSVTVTNWDDLVAGL